MYLVTLFLNCNPCFISCQTYDSASLRPNNWCTKVHFGLLYPCKECCECCYFSLTVTVTIPIRTINFYLFHNCQHPSYQMYLVKNNCLQITTCNLVQIKHSTWGNDCCHILSMILINIAHSHSFCTSFATYIPCTTSIMMT